VLLGIMLGNIAALVLPLPSQAAPVQPPGLSLRQIISPPLIPSPSPIPADDVGPVLINPTNAWRIADTNGLPARVRSGPSINAPVVMRLDSGTVVEPLGENASADGYQWRRISVAGAVGWIASSLLLEPSAPPNTPVYVVAAVGDRGLNLREAPSTASTIIASLPAGTVVELVAGPVEAEGRQWRQVRIAGATGWVIAEAIDER
jgi:SH3-like domain-containing protein